MTLEELKEYISRNVDEVTLIDILNLTSEDIVYHCHDIVEDKFDKIVEALELEKENNKDE